MKRFFLFILVTITFYTLVNAQSPTVFISGTVTNLANGSPIANHQVIIRSDSSSGFSFYTTRMTGINGNYDCNIQNVPTTNAVIFFVSTLDCQNYLHMDTVSSIHPQNVVNFAICDNSGT
ncbi:MAG: hypothetical protein WCL00_13910, partial [Bacteroidota bacterium]